MSQRDFKDSFGVKGISTKPSAAPKALKISWTSRSRPEGNHEKYSVEASAAIKSS